MKRIIGLTILSIVIGILIGTFLPKTDAQTHTFAALDTNNIFTGNEGHTGTENFTGIVQITNSLVHGIIAGGTIPYGAEINEIAFPEETWTTCGNNTDVLWGDATLHRLLTCDNGGATTSIALQTDFAAPPAIGNTTPAAGTFTTLSSTSIPSAGPIGATTPAAGTFTALTAATISRTSNCAVNTVSPGACGSSSVGAFVVPTTTTTYTVNTTAVTAASRIRLTPMSFAGNLPGSPTCVAPAVTSSVTLSAISAGTSFTIALPSTAGQTCFQFSIDN